ncbi:hypothetical protein C943_00124 [Mariniradius saccharolyticus AK6]|uniref:Uncharacterized protein n=1 Tax=Mariniradius saccharolyticus AK6 TaxID=1239962 RepID=M7YDY7_9BACT|nr:hypothetical protein C943_00124 [Mariniradius saccharolyticus AK6]
MKILDQIKGAWKKLRRLPTAERFALAPVWVQLVAIFITSAVLIFMMAPFLSLRLAYMIFADPAYYSEAKGPLQLVVGLLQVLLGMVLFSFIISVLSAALVKYIENIRSGSLGFVRSGHMIFVNYNVKLPLILDQLDIRAKERSATEEIVLLFSDIDTVANFRNQMDPKRWKNLDIFVRQGDLMNFKTFERISVFEALSLVILLPDGAQSHFFADNINLKILTTLVNNQQYRKHLEERKASRKPVKCSIELSNNADSRVIAQKMSQALFTVITPGDVIGSILARGKVDIVFYKVFFEVMAFDGSTIHFVNPQVFGLELVGKSFEELYFGFEGGTLLGYSGINQAGEYRMRLCPFGQNLTSSDWLLFLTTKVNRIVFRPSDDSFKLERLDDIIPPTESVAKQICVIGNHNPLGNIDDFIDVQSMRALKEAHFVFDNQEEYFADKFLQRLKSSNFENIVVNLDDETGFRLTMWLVSKEGENDDFLKKIVTILGDPVTENLLSHYHLKFNTVLSHKLSARYIAQISFQKNLDRLFEELAFPEGVEFNLLEIGKHIPHNLVNDRKELTRLLAGQQLIYLGIVDEDKNVYFESSNFTAAKQILVLSQGGNENPDSAKRATPESTISKQKSVEL